MVFLDLELLLTCNWPRFNCKIMLNMALFAKRPFFCQVICSMRANNLLASEDQRTRLARVKAAKRPFRLQSVLDRVRIAVDPFPKAALFELAAEGYSTPFEQLVACILSIRTLDEVTLPTAKVLFATARTPGAMARLSFAQLDSLIRRCTFHEAKTVQIREIARRVEEEFQGQLPCEEEVLLSFRGVGPKCANLVLGIACNQPGIGVDIHVHRVVNRWGYVRAATPEKTMAALHAKLPRKYWIELNSLLVPFGKHICTGRLPKCSTCPVLAWCRQVGVSEHR
jgi:endonuclease-3